MPKIRGLAAHIRAGDKQKLLPARVETEIVGNEALASLAKEFFNDRMTASDDEQLAGRVELGANVAAIGGQLGERTEHVELGDGASRAAKARRLPSDDRANFDKKLAFDFEDALVGG